MKALITGSEGFVGGYLKKELQENGYDVIGVDVIKSSDCVAVDILDQSGLETVIKQYTPDYIFHLAGQADVGKSWSDPQDTFQKNVIGTISLLQATRFSAPHAKLVLIGSSDEYGILREKGIDVTEDIPLHPVSPYAISKTTQEIIARTYVQQYDMDISLTRSFNHTGAGQKKGFIISDFASGIVDIEKGKTDILSVGNLDSARDFTHVLDIVRAYRLIAEKGRTGEVYNVGSGRVCKAQEILDRMIVMSTSDIRIQTDQNKIRPSDTPVICCNHTKLTEHTGWEPVFDLDFMLHDVLDYWRMDH